jgi:hypothetical protein
VYILCVLCLLRNFKMFFVFIHCLV